MHNRLQRLNMDLVDAGIRRSLFRMACRTNQQAGEYELFFYMDPAVSADHITGVESQQFMFGTSKLCCVIDWKSPRIDWYGKSREVNLAPQGWRDECWKTYHVRRGCLWYYICTEKNRTYSFKYECGYSTSFKDWTKIHDAKIDNLDRLHTSYIFYML